MSNKIDGAFADWNGIAIPVFKWSEIDHSIYMSKSTLYEEGYSIKGVQPSGAYYYKRRGLWVFYYDVRKCSLRKKKKRNIAPEKQQEIRLKCEATIKANKTCDICSKVSYSKLNKDEKGRKSCYDCSGRFAFADRVAELGYNIAKVEMTYPVNWDLVIEVIRAKEAGCLEEFSLEMNPKSTLDPFELKVYYDNELLGYVTFKCSYGFTKLLKELETQRIEACVRLLDVSCIVEGENNEGEKYYAAVLGMFIGRTIDGFDKCNRLLKNRANR